MYFSLAIFLAAMGITVLEMSEASAMGLLLHSETHSPTAYLSVALGAATVLVPSLIVGHFLTYFPILYLRIFSATLLLYFGIRLAFSARRAFLKERGSKGNSRSEESMNRSALVTGYSVGTVEAFEAAIVIVALLPENYSSAVIGLLSGIIAVMLGAFILKAQVRKMKQARVKTAMSAILLSFSVFWYAESIYRVSDIILIPLFAVFYVSLYALTSGRKNIVENDRPEIAAED